MNRCGYLLALLTLSAACQQSGIDAAGARPLAKDPYTPSPDTSPPAAIKGRPQGGKPNEAAVAAARLLYQQRCALCHGASGAGDGIAAANLRPPPRSLRDAGWHKSVPDEDIATIIVKGGAAVGKSLMMPPSQDLAGEPETVAALVAVVRGFAER